MADATPDATTTPQGDSVVPVNLRDGNFIVEGQLRRRFAPLPPEEQQPPRLGVTINGRMVDDDADGKITHESEEPRTTVKQPWPLWLRAVVVLFLVATAGSAGAGIVYQSQTSIRIDADGIEQGGTGVVDPVDSEQDEGGSVREPGSDVETTSALLSSGAFETLTIHDTRTIYLGHLATEEHAVGARAFIAQASLDGDVWTLVDMRAVMLPDPPQRDEPTIPDGMTLVSDDELRILRACRALLQQWQSTDRHSLHHRMYPEERTARDNALAGR